VGSQTGPPRCLSCVPRQHGKEGRMRPDALKSAKITSPRKRHADHLWGDHVIRSNNIEGPRVHNKALWPESLSEPGDTSCYSMHALASAIELYIFCVRE
jgi:1,2-phenylacetyl-CoA epoxidase PaaB subunit